MAGLLQKLGGLLAGRPDVDGSLEAASQAALAKGWRTQLPIGEPAHPLRSLTINPMSLVASLGYKDRPSALTYETLKRMAQQVSIVAAIIQRRVNQVAAMSEPFRMSKSLGFEIRHKDNQRETTRAEKKFIQNLELFIANCGERDAIRRITDRSWDGFEGFLRKLTRDSLIFDAATFEIVPDRAGHPCGFAAIDSSTIRHAVTDEDLETGMFGPRGDHAKDLAWTRWPHANLRDLPPPERVDFVQLWQGQVVNTYSKDELAYCIRNPRTDLYVNLYGLSELEVLVHVCTSILWAEEYNRNFFRNGSVPKGILNFRTDTPDVESLEAFRTYWNAQMTGAENSWRLPIFESEGLEFINLQLSNRDQEYSEWLNYQVKLACSLYGMDPAEIGFDISRSNASQPLFENTSDRKLSESKENGLRPLLRFIARALNEHIIDRIDDHFYLTFVGLDELSESEKMQLRTQEITTYKTIDEVRAEADLQPLPDGSGAIVLNPVWAQFQQLQQQAAMEEQEAATTEPAQEQAIAPEPTTQTDADAAPPQSPPPVPTSL